MSLGLWHTMLQDAVYWQTINENLATDLYHRTAVAWGDHLSYHLNGGSETVDLTKLFEQYKMLVTLKGNNYEKESNWNN